MNIIEITNEIFITMIIAYMFCMSNEDKWADSSTGWFMRLLTINSTIVGIISMGKISNINSTKHVT
jgi:hypothetical protein